MQTYILADREIRHRSDTQGVVVTREQTIEIEGRRYVAKYWHDWQSGRLVRVESREAN